MSEAKFTKGEWIASRECSIEQSDYEVIVTDYNEEGFQLIAHGALEHDAHLIAAAPEMYAMLVEFEEFTSKMHYQGRSLTVKESIRLNKMTNKLLAKARGE